MRILLDHCVDRRLAESLGSHYVKTAREMGWEQLKNGELLKQASEQFDVMLTIDRNIKHQQNLARLPIAVAVLIARSNRLADLQQLVPQVEITLLNLQPRTLVEITI